ncbi:MAG: (2Fe-2S)-binding protein [Bryobacteraceae bacterium]
MLSIFLNGRLVQVPDGISVAAALLGAGVTAFRHSISGEPRAALCGMGICFECRVTIDGRAQQKSCQVTCCEGMKVDTA